MARAWYFKAYPDEMPTLDHVELKDLPETALAPGQIRVRNQYLSVDPYMRGRMTTVKSYVEGFKIGEPMTGGAVGEVIESAADGYAVGDKVLHMAGWRDESVVDTSPLTGTQKLPDLPVPIQTYLHNLGLTGATAYFGLLKVAEAKAGDVVFVSAAAGAVGSAVVQIAKKKGMTVIGSAGGADKCDWVRQLGAAECIDYKAGAVLPQLARVAPDGIDVYFDNVGGEHLDAALGLANERARFAICGMIEMYNTGAPTQLRFAARIIGARIRIQGFIVSDYMGRAGEFYNEMGGWLQNGQLVREETIHDGLASMPDAFLGLFSGGNKGKMLVRV